MAAYAEELARLLRERDEALERLERAEQKVPWTMRGSPSPDPKVRRLQKNVVVASRAYERLKNDWFPPEYADCVEGFEMCMFGPNAGKIRPYGSRGKWRDFPKYPFWDLDC